MGRVEQLAGYFNRKETPTVSDLARRLDGVENEIRQSWENYKRHQFYMHGIEENNNGLRMILLWMLEQGIIPIHSDEQ